MNTVISNEMVYRKPCLVTGTIPSKKAFSLFGYDLFSYDSTSTNSKIHWFETHNTQKIDIDVQLSTDTCITIQPLDFYIPEPSFFESFTKSIMKMIT